MRISTSMLHQSAMGNLRSTLANLARLQMESASGKKLTTLSDNPADAAQVMQLGSQLRDIEQYRRNANDATTKLNTEDAVLNTVQELMQTVQELAIGITSNDPNDPSRTRALDQVQAIVGSPKREVRLVLGRIESPDRLLRLGLSRGHVGIILLSTIVVQTIDWKADLGTGRPMPTSRISSLRSTPC